MLLSSLLWLDLSEEIIQSVNTVNFEVLSVDKLVEGFRIYH